MAHGMELMVAGDDLDEAGPGIAEHGEIPD
jgi:hypothetical protein